MPPGNGLVSKRHGTDHPTCADQLKSEPIITTWMSVAAWYTSDSHGGYSIFTDTVYEMAGLMVMVSLQIQFMSYTIFTDTVYKMTYIMWYISLQVQL